MRVAILVFAALVAQSSVVASKDEPVRLAPSSTWQLSYDPESCRLSRSFGEGDNTVLLHLSKYAPGTAIEAIISGKHLEPSVRFLEAAFGPGDRPARIENALYGEGSNGTTWQFSTGLVPKAEYKTLAEKHDHRATSLDQREKARAAEIRYLEIAKGTKTPVVLETGSLAQPMEAMDTCLDDLVKSWGFDPEIQRALSGVPKPANNPARWIGPQDYPNDALRNGLSGSVRFRLTIEPDGKVSACKVQSALSDPAFEEITCKLVVARARFEPALDTAGRAVQSYWAENIIYRAYR